MPGSPSSPSLRGPWFSTPRAGGDSDPQPPGRPKSHPTRQPLTTADSAVASSLVAPARRFSLAGPGCLRHGGAPVPGWAGGGRARAAGWRLPRGSRGGRRGKAKAKGGRGAVPAAAAARATGPARSALRRCRRSSPASPALLSPARHSDPFRPKTGPRETGSLSHFVRLLPRCPAGQGEVRAQWRLRRGQAEEPAVKKTIVGSRRLLMGELLGGAAVPAGKRASRGGECLGGGARGAERD